MARPLREDDDLGSTHHVFVRGVARSKIIFDTTDYERALSLLEQTVLRFELRCQAWCYLPNHFHLILTSDLGNLSDAMQWHGTLFAQSFNQRYGRIGHLFQGRFGSRLVEDDAHLIELARYLPLNPVGAGLCDAPENWPWSSYAFTLGIREAPWFLDARDLMEMVGPPATYAAWVAETGGAPSKTDLEDARPPLQVPLDIVLRDGSDAAIERAHRVYGYSKTSIARSLGCTRFEIARRLARHAAGDDPLI